MEKCTNCGTPNAYISAYKIECLDHRCKFFSKSWLEEFLKSQLCDANSSNDFGGLNLNKMSNAEFEREIDKAIEQLNDFVI